MADDLNRWLRAVRPGTAADDGFADSAAGQATLDAIHARAARTVRARPSRRWRPVLFPVAVAAVAVTALTLTASGTPPTHKPPHLAAPVGPAPFAGARPAAQVLDPYRSCDDLLRGLRSHLAASVGPYGLPGTIEGDYKTVDGGVPASVPMAAARATGAGTSTTNDQEAGADEPDIVKTDGNRVVTVTGGVLRVIDATGRTVTGTLDLRLYAGWPSAQLLVAADSALVFLAGGGYPYAGPMASPGQAGLPGMTVLFVDLAGQPQVSGSLHTDARYLDARLVGGTVRVVTESTPNIVTPRSSGTDQQRLARNRAAVQRAPLSAWQPSYTVIDRGSTTSHTVPCTAISHPGHYSGASLLSIYTLDIAHPASDAQPISVAADGDTVYATTASLYVASTPYYGASDVTQLHRFDIAGTGKPRYLGSGSVPGSLVDRYALSEYQGRLRVATTTGRNGGLPGSGAPPVSSGVYVLDADTLARLGAVTGLAPHEQIYAVRYVGPLSYVVTFRRTDPLFVVDLSDPRHPRVAGSLELTGYSDYLHDIGGGRLLGVGQQVDGSGVVSGVQVSLFDVSNPAKPRLLSRLAVPGTPDEAQLDPHAFLYWPPTGVLAVPLQSWNSQNPGVLVVRVHDSSLTRRGVVTNPVTADDDGLGVQRSLIVDGALWTLSASGVAVSDPGTLARASWIAFG